MASELRMKETVAPSAPPSGYVTLYAKTDGAFYTQDDAGTETELGAFDLVASVAGTANEITVTDDGDGTITLSLPDNITVKGVTLTGGTVTDDAPLINATQTWNDAADTFTAVKVNVTDTNSAAASKLLDLQKGGSTALSVGKNGDLTQTMLGTGYATFTMKGNNGTASGDIIFKKADGTTIGEIWCDANILKFSADNASTVMLSIHGTSNIFTPKLVVGTNATVTNTAGGGTLHVWEADSGEFLAGFQHSHATNPQAIYILHSATNNGTGNAFMRMDEGGGSALMRFHFRSNGGLENYSANNVNLSDATLKTDITVLASEWEAFKQIEIVKYKYKDQTHEDFNYGVIAQQVEAVYPELVDEIPHSGVKGNEKLVKSVYENDIKWIGMRVLQEAMLKIEELERKVATLEARLNG